MTRLCLIVALLLGSVAERAAAGVLASATWVENVLGVSIAVPVIATGTSTETSVSVSLEMPAFVFEAMTPVAVAPTFATMTTVRLTLPFAPGMPTTPNVMISATASGAKASQGIAAKASVRVGASQGQLIRPIYRIWFSPGVVRTPAQIYPTPYFEVPPFGTTIRVYPTSFGWTPGAVTLTGLTEDGAAAPDAKAKGAFGLDAFGAGTVTLVAPRRISFQGDPLGDRTVGSFTTLTLHFVPEPFAWLMLAGTAGALALRARRQARAPVRQRPDA